MRQFLLIDDDKYEFMFVNFLLKDHYGDGFKLGYASTVEEGKIYLSSNRVDVILLDDKLDNGLTSADTIPQLQKRAFNVPIIIISKDISGPHLKDRARLGLNKVVDKFKLKSALAGGLLDKVAA
jgi:response regulator of citrate/malate metabolism